MSKPSKGFRKRRIIAAELAVAAGGSVEDVPRLFSLCIFFESWIECGGDRTQKNMKLLLEETAALHVLRGGKP